jgi:hypothetical protein
MDDNTDLVEGVPDGMLLADWAAEHDVGKTTSYAFIKILRAMGIEVRSVRKKGASKPSPFLEGQSLAGINHLLMQHRNGRTVAQLEADHISAIVAAQPEPIIEASIPDAFDPSLLLNRLQAAELAISTGLPLTRQELCWIIGMADTSRIPSTRIRIGRTSFQKWTLLAPTSENLIQVGQTP